MEVVCESHCVPPTARVLGLVARNCGTSVPNDTEACAVNAVLTRSGWVTATVNVVVDGVLRIVYIRSSSGEMLERKTCCPAWKPCAAAVVTVMTFDATAAKVTETSVALPKLLPVVEMQPPDPSSPAETTTITPMAASWFIITSL